jgi:hypothetical protein
MARELRSVPGIGDDLAEALRCYGFTTKIQMKAADGVFAIKKDAFDALKDDRIAKMLPPLPESYYTKLHLLCAIAVASSKFYSHSEQVVPSFCRCPLTLNWFVDAVVAPDGTCFEREAIENWLKDHPGVHPFDANVFIDKDMLYPCENMKRCTAVIMSERRNITIP